MSRMVGVLVGLVVIFALLASDAPGADLGPLRAGAAKVDVTPDANAIPKPFTSILDHLYTRAIFLDNGRNRAVLLNADIIGIAEPSWERVSGEISRLFDVPVSNILISATHDHSAIFSGLPGGPPDPNASAFEAKLEAGMVGAVG